MHNPIAVDIDALLAQFVANTDEDIFFVQIGANDGEKEDFIAKYIDDNRWNGIMVEPVFHLFQKLQNKYEAKGIILENVAIASHTGEQDIFRLPVDVVGQPKWAGGLASFSKDVILSHGMEIPNISELVVVERVATTTLSALLSKYFVKNIHILHIDTEGYDFEIIKMIDFEKIRPEVIIFEYAHISVYNYYKAIAFLENKKYKVLHNQHSFDIIAIDESVL